MERGQTDPRKASEHNVDVNRFRVARFARFAELLELVDVADRPIRILDVGGTVPYWQGLKPLWAKYRLEITILNYGAEDGQHGEFRIVGGDARDVAFDDMAFDIVHSNSVIEHVGAWRDIEAMAAEVRRLAPHYYVQTPNYWFPLEPHFRAPFFQYLPKWLRARLLMSFKLGFRERVRNYDDALHDVGSVYLLGRRQMKRLFPDARIESERFYGLAKSLIAIR
ncbi:hypothetical protein ASG07_04275 [Sphingomonas sp. Leaf343]|nr:hypothetical protein ASG07_04275 [Sphingomonas sp. Leaf343]